MEPPWRENDSDSSKPVTDVTKDKIVRYGGNHSGTQTQQKRSIAREKRDKHNEEEISTNVPFGNVLPTTTHNSNVILPAHSTRLSSPVL